MAPYFQIGQNVRSVNVLNAIAAFLASLTTPVNAPSLPPVTMGTVINKKTNVQTNTVNGVDTLFFLLLPLFLDLTFVTRKGIDFHL